MLLNFRCIICAELIPEPRAVRGCRTCNNDCAREAHRRLRNKRAEMFCRLCHRPIRRKRQDAPLLPAGPSMPASGHQSVVEVVRRAHNPIDVTVGFPEERAS